MTTSMTTLTCTVLRRQAFEICISNLQHFIPISDTDILIPDSFHASVISTIREDTFSNSTISSSITISVQSNCTALPGFLVFFAVVLANLAEVFQTIYISQVGQFQCPGT